MQFAEMVSLVALLISLASLAASLYFNLRDRARILATSTYYPGLGHDAPSLSLSVVNAGRRPIVLRMWGGNERGGEWVGTMINSHEGGKRLGEHERYDISLKRDDLLALTPDGDVLFTDLWVEDSLGRRHRVVNAKEHVRKLWGRRVA